MEKEFEALDKIDNTLCLNNIRGKLDFEIDAEEHTDCDSVTEMTECLDILKSALTELKAIKEAKPSEALERTSSEFIDGYPTGNVNVAMTWEEHSAIKQALLKAQEQEKVLEVIFEKPLSLLVLKLFERSGIFDLEYEFFVEGYKAVIEDINQDVKEQIVTEEEFDLLKRH